jgi:hypothetical protein
MFAAYSAVNAESEITSLNSILEADISAFLSELRVSSAII